MKPTNWLSCAMLTGVVMCGGNAPTVATPLIELATTWVSVVRRAN